jgi:hypothetical protein
MQDLNWVKQMVDEVARDSKDPDIKKLAHAVSVLARTCQDIETKADSAESKAGAKPPRDYSARNDRSDASSLGD